MLLSVLHLLWEVHLYYRRCYDVAKAGICFYAKSSDTKVYI